MSLWPTDLWPIYIPSLGRAKTIRLPGDAGPRVIVVEPHEYDDYREALPQDGVVPLPKSGRGLSYSRNHIRSRALALGYEWFWMIDDDVSAYYEVMDRKCIEIPADEALRRAQAIAIAEDAAVVALEYQQFAWSSPSWTRRNSYCDVVVGVNTRKTRLCSWREGMKHDRDFALQVIASGQKTIRVTRLAFSCPKNGSNAGGLFASYRAGHEERSVEEMVRRWPGICTRIVKPSGRVDAKISWAKAAAAFRAP